MPDVLPWRRAGDPQAVVRRAAQTLAEGRLVAFPTETVYGLAASALVPEAVELLRQSKGRPVEKPLALAVRGLADALDYVPGMSALGRRLAWRCWPGPVTLVFGDGVADGLVGRLPETVRQRLCPADSLGLRTPAHEAILKVLRLLPGPLVLTSANRSGEPAATTVEQVVQAVGDDVALVIDDGPCHYGQASTVVKVHGDHWDVLREGVFTKADLERQSACVIVFVCTGNTCRSPLAEGLCKKLLADRLVCSPEELPARGFLVLSAGLSAMMGGTAAVESVEAAREFGVDLTSHRSRPLTAELVAQADHLVVMTQGHALALTAQHRRLRPRPRLLCPGGGDIADPIGCDQQVYHECAQQIRRHLEEFVAGLLP